jgi:flagellin-like hook-associated protein FlgL
LAITADSYLPFEIKSLENDFTGQFLGLEGSGVPSRPLEVLFELREAVENGDLPGVQNLLSEIEAVQKHITEIHGGVGSRLAMAEGAKTTLEVKNLNLTETLSKIGDADLSETLMLYQNAQASYEASLLLASNIYQLTLANFL